jgi:hypothetical protein
MGGRGKSERGAELGATMVHGDGGAAAGGRSDTAAASRSRGVSALALSARGPRVSWSSASRRLQGTFSEPVPLNATDTYPPGYPGSKHIPDERHTGTQMNGLMVWAAARPPSPRAHACAGLSTTSGSQRLRSD